mgnify:CR=1 FL=1
MSHLSRLAVVLCAAALALPLAIPASAKGPGASKVISMVDTDNDGTIDLAEAQARKLERLLDRTGVRDGTLRQHLLGGAFFLPQGHSPGAERREGFSGGCKLPLDLAMPRHESGALFGQRGQFRALPGEIPGQLAMQLADRFVCHLGEGGACCQAVSVSVAPRDTRAVLGHDFGGKALQLGHDRGSGGCRERLTVQIDRLAADLDEMTRRTDTRFLIITHHAVTMARMDRLFGVTMVEQGVSQLVSVDLKRAEALVA